jgi:putative membrane protein
MKNKFIIIAVVAVGALFVAGASQAIQPYPPLKGGMSDTKNDPKKKSASPTPAPKAAATATLSSQDKSFMMNAAKGGMMEVEMGKVAAQNGQSADVKKFGNRMVADHSKMNSELMALATAKGVKLPGAKAAGKWKSDKDYMDMMVKDHEMDLAEFQKEAKGGGDADLKKFADKNSKIIQKHLSMAKETQGKLK